MVVETPSLTSNFQFANSANGDCYRVMSLRMRHIKFGSVLVTNKVPYPRCAQEYSSTETDLTILMVTDEFGADIGLLLRMKFYQHLIQVQRFKKQQTKGCVKEVKNHSGGS